MRDVVHKAFWDQLQEQLDQDPPLYDNALQLLKEIKEVNCFLISYAKVRPVDKGHFVTILRILILPFFHDNVRVNWD